MLPESVNMGELHRATIMGIKTRECQRMQRQQSTYVRSVEVLKTRAQVWRHSNLKNTERGRRGKFHMREKTPNANSPEHDRHLYGLEKKSREVAKITVGRRKVWKVL
jgi:hypothetical protein